jgi:hypothetical protein
MVNSNLEKLLVASYCPNVVHNIQAQGRDMTSVGLVVVEILYLAINFQFLYFLLHVKMCLYTCFI